MGQDVVDVDKVLSEVMGRYCKKLCSLGVLRNSDFQTVCSLSIVFSSFSILIRYFSSVHTVVVINLIFGAFNVAKTDSLFLAENQLTCLC